MQANLSDILQTKRGQTALVLLVVGIGIGGTALGALNIRNNVYGAFFSEDGNSQLFSYDLGSENNVSSTQDTDKDGLTDNEENNIYGTSPYLADSDSDGISDFEEINSGSDPNCPIGKVCDYETTVATNDPNTSNEPSVQGLTANQLRELLLQQGVTEQELGQLTDQQLLDAYQAAISGAQNNTTSPLDDYKNLSASEIKELLISKGVPASTFEGLSDEQVVQLYEQTLSELGQ